MSMRILFGIKIYLQSRYTQDTSIGLYTPASPYNSQLRWISGTMANIPWAPNEYYTNGFITAKSIIELSDSTDFRRQGNVSTPSDFKFSVDNTNQLFKTLEDLGITLNGLSVDITMFDMQFNTRTVLLKGVAYLDSYNETEYIINVKTAAEKRNANIATVIDEENYPDASEDMKGEIIPILYGKADKAKFIRTVSKTDYFNTDLISSNYLTPQGQTIFPCIGGPAGSTNWNFLDTPIIWIRIGADDSPTLTHELLKTLYNFVGKYVHVVKGHHEGYFRKIKKALYHPSRQIITGTSNVSPFPTTFASARDYPILELWLETHFPEDHIHGNWLAIDGEDEFGYNNGDEGYHYDFDVEVSWVEIMDLNFIYQASEDPLTNFLDENGNVTTSVLTAFSFGDETKIQANPITSENEIKINPESYKTIPSAGLTIYGSDKNKIKLSADFMSNDVDSLDSFTYVDPKAIAKMTSDHMGAYVVSSYDPPAWEEAMDNVLKIADGFYTGLHKTGSPTVTLRKDPTDLSVLTDGNYDTYARWVWSCPSFDYRNFIYPHRYNTIALEIDLPDLPEEFEFDEVYLAVAASGGEYNNIGSEEFRPDPDLPELDGLHPGNMYMFARTKRFYSGVEDVYFPIEASTVVYPEDDPEYGQDAFEGTLFWRQDPDNEINFYGGNFNNFLTTYWNSGHAPSNINAGIYNNGYGEKSFYRSDEVNYVRVGGHNLLQLNITKENWRNVHKLGLFFMHESNYHGYGSDYAGDHEYLKIHQIKFLFKKKITIKDEVYVPIQGKKVNGTFAEDPITILKDIVSRQNWSDLSTVIPPNGWGRSISTAALIKTDASHGSFNYSGLNYIKANIKACVNITEEDNAWTEDIIKKLCQQFWLCSFQDNNGYECVDYICDDYDGGGSVSVTLADIVGEIDPIKFDSDTDIFVKPYVRFNYDPATKKYLSEIRITNVEKPTYNSSYVKTVNATISAETAQSIWNSCHALYLKYLQINEPSSNQTDLSYIIDDDTAIWYLQNWIGWQNKKRIKFSVPFEKAYSWYVTMRFSLTLPFHTNNDTKYCMIEKIARELPTGDASDLVQVTAIIY